MSRGGDERSQGSRPVLLLVVLAVLVASIVGLFVLPAHQFWWTVDVTILAVAALIVLVRLGRFASSSVGTVGRHLRQVRELRETSPVFVSLLSFHVITALRALGVAVPPRQAWIFVAIAPGGLELWTDTATGTPAFTVPNSARVVLQGGPESPDRTPLIEVTLPGPRDEVTFDLGIFDDTQKPATGEFLDEIVAALKPHGPAPAA